MSKSNGMKLNISISNSNKCQTKHFDSGASENAVRFTWWKLSWDREKTTPRCTAVMVKSMVFEETQTKSDPGNLLNLPALVSSLAWYEY